MTNMLYLVIMQFIRQIRLSLGITQTALANRSGLRQEVIARLEKDSYRNPRILTLRKLLAALGYELHLEAIPKQKSPLSPVEKSFLKDQKIKFITSAKPKKVFRFTP